MGPASTLGLAHTHSHPSLIRMDEVGLLEAISEVDSAIRISQQTFDSRRQYLDALKRRCLEQEMLGAATSDDLATFAWSDVLRRAQCCLCEKVFMAAPREDLASRLRECAHSHGVSLPAVGFCPFDPHCSFPLASLKEELVPGFDGVALSQTFSTMTRRDAFCSFDRHLEVCPFALRILAEDPGHHSLMVDSTMRRIHDGRCTCSMSRGGEDCFYKAPAAKIIEHEVVPSYVGEDGIVRALR